MSDSGRLIRAHEGSEGIVGGPEGLGGLRLQLLELDAPYHNQAEEERGLILLRGQASFQFPGGEAEARRASLFDDLPWTLHLAPGAPLDVRPGAEGASVALVSVDSQASFAPRVLGPDAVRVDLRGRGAVADAAFREVRTMIDDVAGPSDAQLVLGEVVTLPGRWSSYPPHHHKQPEIYHYRFTSPQGYGHAELGETVHKVRAGDTVFIGPGQTHAQVAAPGYGMWYLWAIRHLESARYDTPTFDSEHRWTMAPGAPAWSPDRD